jgi:hypothetical protein
VLHNFTWSRHEDGEHMAFLLGRCVVIKMYTYITGDWTVARESHAVHLNRYWGHRNIV